MTVLAGIWDSKRSGLGKRSVNEMLGTGAEDTRCVKILEYQNGTSLGWRLNETVENIVCAQGQECTSIVASNVFCLLGENEQMIEGGSDAQCVVDAYERGSELWIDDFDGTFIIVIVDPRKERLLLYRDRVGYTPLYFYQNEKCFIFSTSIRSMLRSSLFEKRVNRIAMNNFLSYGYIPCPDTPYKGILQVRPGHVLLVKKGKVTEKPHWKFQYAKKKAKRIPDVDTIESFRDIFKQAVSRRLEKYSEAGAFLSGGLDTSIVAAVMKELTEKKFKVFTAGFEEKAFDETKDARIVAEHLDLDLHTVKVRFDKNFPELLEKIVFHHESPFADTSAIPSYFAAKLAREHVSTVLTGDFPDQLIGGSGHQVAAMQRETTDPAWRRWMRNGLLQSITTKLPWQAGGSGILDRAKRFFYREGFPLEEQRILLGMPVPPLLKRALYSEDFLEVNRRHDTMEVARSFYRQVSDESLLNKILYFDIHSYAIDDLMVKVNRMTEAHGLNAVSPFHDRDVVEFVATLPDDLKINGLERKVIMRRAFGHLLPEHTLRKKKQGFAMPIGEWLVSNLADYVRDILLDPRTLNRGYFNKKFMRKMVDNFLSGKTDYASGSESTIICLLTLELWHRLFIDK